MYGLKVYLFGHLRVICDGGTTEVKLTRTLQTLLAFLLLKRNSFYTREYLAGLLWGDQSEEHARGRLNTAIWRLRHSLGNETCASAKYLVSNETGEFGFNWGSDYWLDLSTFEDQIKGFVTKPIQDICSRDLAQAENTLQLYTSDLLSEFHEEWALREREKARLLFLNGASHLMSYYTSQNLFEQSIAYGQQILSVDPLREEVHRELIRLYLVIGQRAMAVHQFKACRELLMAELGIEPMQETRNIYELVLASSGVNQDTDLKANGLAYYKVLKQLNKAISTLNNAQTQIQQALKMLEDL